MLLVKCMKQLVIANKSTQRQILTKLSQEQKLVAVKFLTWSELLEHLYFRYDKRAVYYLVKTYQMKPAIANEALEAMYRIDSNAVYQNKKLQMLQQMKQALLAEHLFILDPLFPIYLKSCQVVITELPDDRFYEKVILDLKQYTTVKVDVEESKPVYPHSIYEFANTTDEVRYVATEICRKLESGIAIEHIKLCNVSREYQTLIERIFPMYHIPVRLPVSESIYSTTLVQAFLEELDTMPAMELLERLLEQYPSSMNSQIIPKIVAVMNEYTWYDNELKDIKELLIDDFKQIPIPSDSLREAVDVIELDQIAREDHVFLLGFNTDTMPHVYKNEAYLTDAMQVELGYSTTLERNKKVKARMVRLLDQSKQLVITYRRKGKTGDCYPSSLIPLLYQAKVITDYPKKDVIYSKLDASLILAAKLDQVRKYGVQDPDLEVLRQTIGKIPYMAFDHQYQPIAKEDIHRYLMEQGGLVLSYTNLDKYMKCGFYYYLDCLLKLRTYEETFMTLIGNYFHHMLEVARKPSFQFDEETTRYFAEKTLSHKEQFLLTRLSEELRMVIEVVLYQESLSKHQRLHFETRIAFDLNYPVPVTMKGFIDKIMEREEDGVKYLSLIDYKTGHFDIQLDSCIHGFHLQLPSYAYMIKQCQAFENSKITGIYIAPILPNMELMKPKEDPNVVRREAMRLVGYSTSNEDWLKKFDHTYQDSVMIKGMKMTSKGFGPYAKILSESQMQALTHLAERKIKEAAEHILQADFTINPKQLQDKNMSCQFCPYADICYHDYQDIVYLKSQRYQDFLGGDGDATLDG